MITILKIGGELLEGAAAIRDVARAAARLAAQGPLVIVHGGGRAIDAELRARGIEPAFVDGLRITDAATLDVVVSVLGGRNNTAFVAALNAAGVEPLVSPGQTQGSGFQNARRSLRQRPGSRSISVSSGSRSSPAPRLLSELVSDGYVPVIASIGVDARRHVAERQRRHVRRAPGGVGRRAAADHRRRHGGCARRRRQPIPELSLERMDEMIGPAKRTRAWSPSWWPAAMRSRSGVTNVTIVSGRDICRISTKRRARASAHDVRRRVETCDWDDANDDEDGDVIATEEQHVLQVYRRSQVVFERGSGCYLYAQDGRRYLDLISGVGVAALGHANPKLATAITRQAAEVLHVSNLFFHPLQAEVASKLSALSGLERTFFCNSGTEAVEACLKFARRYWHATGNAAAPVRRVRARVSRAHDGFVVGDLGRPLPRSLRALARRRRLGAGRRSGGVARGRERTDSRGDCRTDPGRRRRPAVVAGDGRRHRGELPRRPVPC